MQVIAPLKIANEKNNFLFTDHPTNDFPAAI